MSPRAMRRAQERRAADQARKAAAISEAKLAANRANGQLSTGPASQTGKAASSLNALKTGLTGRTVLVPSDDAETYSRHIAAYHTEYKPIGLRECELVQSLAETRWRLSRIGSLEMAIYAQGHVEFAGACEDHIIELQTHLKYEKQLRNLQIQEARLHRRYQMDMAELYNLQKERGAREEPAGSTKESLAATHGCELPTGGFEFSTADSSPQLVTSPTTESLSASLSEQSQASHHHNCA